MSDKLLKEEKEKKVLATRDTPRTGTGVEGQEFGNIDVTTVMVDKTGVQGMIDAAIVTVYKPGGSLSASQITSALLVAANEGKVYNASEDFTTTADFIEGAGITYPAGTNIVVINTAGEGQAAAYKFDVLGGMDKSVVRGIALEGDPDAEPYLPTNGIVTLPLAASNDQDGLVEYPGIVRLTDSIISSEVDASCGYAATPKAVADALLSATNFASTYFAEHEHTYDLTNVLSSNAQVLVFTSTVNGTTTSSNIELSAATDVDLGLVKLTDDYTLISGVLSNKIAITPSGVLQAREDAISAAEKYFDDNEHTYSLSNAVSSNTQVLTFTETVSGATTASADVVISAATSSVPGIVTLDDSIVNTSATTSANVAATPAAVASALTSATTYTDNAISGLVDSLSAAQVDFLPSETLSTHVEEDGVVTVTKQAIAITESQVTDLYTGLANALSASTFSTQPTTVNQTITLLMNLINALKGLAPASNTPEEP